MIEFGDLGPYSPAPGVPHYSPSAITSHRKCMRQRAFRRWSHLPRLGTTYFDFGLKLDAHADRWLLHGKPPPKHTPEGDLFIHGIDFIPPPGVAATQVPLTCTVDGVELRGYADWVAPNPPAMLLAALGADPEAEAWFGDHKAYADPIRWGLTPTTLLADVQGVVYSQGLLESLDLESIPGRWVYYNKRAPTKTAPVDALFTRAGNRVHLQALIPTLDELREIDQYLAPDPNLDRINEVPNEPAACDSCGRNCDFAEYCQIHNGHAVIR